MSSSAHDYKLSLPMAVFININIMLGAGIFVNTPELAKRAGALGAFSYLLVGLLMLPLILSIAQLLRRYPTGGFYTFAQKEINTFSGFLSGWSYFTSKLASATVMTHVSVSLLQQLFPVLNFASPFVFDVAIICLFVGLNMLNIKAGSSIQKMFITFKTIPIIFAILSGIFLMQGDNFSASHLIWPGVATSLPIVIYALIGFEAACSVSSKIKNPEKNAPLAVLISFAIVVTIATIYQLLFYGVLGSTLQNVADYRGAFPALLQAIMPNSPLIAHKLEALLHIAIASSTLGAAYGIIFSNSWNLYTLAQNNHIMNASLFTKLNNHFIPFACVFVEGALCFVYLAVSQGNIVPLQQIGALGCVIAYCFSAFALWRAIQRDSSITLSKWVPLLGLASCAILLTACINSFFVKGMSSLVIYSVLIIIGVGMYNYSKKIALS